VLASNPLVSYIDCEQKGIFLSSASILPQLVYLTDGNLGAHLRKLEEAGYITMTKTFVNKKPHTFVEATGSGRQAFAEHVAALETILNGNKRKV
jgi:DNA-binding MarR family transcriptional regulator